MYTYRFAILNYNNEEFSVLCDWIKHLIDLVSEICTLVCAYLTMDTRFKRFYHFPAALSSNIHIFFDDFLICLLANKNFVVILFLEFVRCQAEDTIKRQI